MSEGSVFESIGRVLLRIDEIKKRFGCETNLDHGVSFCDRLEQVNAGQSADLTVREIAAAEGNGLESEFTTQPAFYNELIEAASEKYSVPTSLIKAVIQQESNFDKNAVSRKGAIGLM
jgi:soluble lytic murein transglycosylase-like protein